MSRSKSRLLKAALESLEARRLLSGVTFGAPTDYPAGISPTSFITADVNGDGRPDIVTANYTALHVNIANSDGTFQLSQDSPQSFSENSPTVIVAGDFRNTAVPDIALGNRSSGKIAIVRNNGDGTFADALTGSFMDLPAGNSESFAAGDLTGNGATDLVVGTNQGTAVVFLSNFVSNGSFLNPITVNIPNGVGGEFVTLGDVNNDGKPDLIAINQQTSKVSVLLGTGDGHFVKAANAASTYGAGQTPLSVAVGDINNDGNADLIIGAQSGIVRVMLGNGDGTFKKATQLSLIHIVDTVAISDVNLDGKPDLIVAGDGGQKGHVRVFLGNGDGTFGPVAIDQTTQVQAPIDAVATDISGDGRPDLMSLGTQTGTVEVSLNTTPNVPIVSHTGSVINVTGTSGNDTVTVTAGAGNILHLSIDSVNDTFSTSQISFINFGMGAGDDSVTLGAGVPSCNVGGAGGNDTIVDNSSAATTLRGGAGLDSISAGSGNDSLDGGTGRDTLVAGSGNDTLSGDNASDLLMGGSGSSILLGGNNNDTLIAGTGNNNLRGNDGNDSLDGSGGGNNVLSGGPGDDTLVGTQNSSTGADTLIGGTGNNSILQQGSRDVVS